jgi:hypothetical protein
MKRLTRDQQRALIIDRVREVDHSVVADQINEVLDVLDHEAKRLGYLAGVLKTGPQALLVGAPPSIGRLVIELRARGVSLPEPTCARCRGVGHALIRTEEGGVCVNCREIQLGVQCRRCGVVRPVSKKQDRDKSICPKCARPTVTCSRCGRTSEIRKRADKNQSDLCRYCYRTPTAVCIGCGKERRCRYVAAGNPTCNSCAPKLLVICAHCHRERTSVARLPEGRVCGVCYRAALSRRGRCTGCGEERRLVSPGGPGSTMCATCSDKPDLPVCQSCGIDDLRVAEGKCAKCVVEVRARELIGDIDGPLGPIYEALRTTPSPKAALQWLSRSKASTVLADVARGSVALTHEALDRYPSRRGADLLRKLLVEHGVLPPRNDVLARLEAWMTARIDQVTQADDRRILLAYKTWHVLLRTRQRADKQRDPTLIPIDYPKSLLNSAVDFLSFLRGKDKRLTDCTQSDVDEWASARPHNATKLRDFLGWAATHTHAQRLSIPWQAFRRRAVVDDDQRWATARRLLHDDNIELIDRVAGCLVVLYGQSLKQIVVLDRDQIVTDHGRVQLSLGSTPIDVPSPLDALLVRLVKEGRSRRATGSAEASQWLFPGLDGTHPMTPPNLGNRLQRIGVRCSRDRPAALAHLALNMHPAMVAQHLGISAHTACRWLRATGADWNTYAAQIVRQDHRETVKSSS